MGVRARWTIALVMVALVVGCTGTSEDTTAQDGHTSAPAGEGPTEVAPVPSGRLLLTGWQQRLQNGLGVDLRAIEADTDGNLFVEVEATTSRVDVTLVRFSTYLFDDLGNRYELVPPEDDPGLSVPSDSLATMRLSFAGPVAVDARHVSLVVNGVNDRIVTDADNTMSDPAPGFFFGEIPLPGVGLEAEARTETAALQETREVEVGRTYTHEQGVEVIVERIEADARTVWIHLRANNPGDERVRLRGRPPRLDDDADTFYEAVQQTDAENQERYLELAPGAEAEVTLAFRGAVPIGAEALQLELNRPTESSGLHPHVLIDDLPVPPISDAAPGTSGDVPERAPEPPETASERVGEPVAPVPSTVSLEPLDAPRSIAEIRIREIIVEFDGEATDEGTLLTLDEPILFDFDSAQLKPDAREHLDDIADVLAYYPDAPVVIIGHTDDQGSAEYNLELSQDRADAVSDALRERGIPDQRLTAEGRGLSEPVASNDTDEGRAENRRVEILIIGVEPPQDE